MERGIQPIYRPRGGIRLLFSKSWFWYIAVFSIFPRLFTPDDQFEANYMVVMSSPISLTLINKSEHRD